jgi:hypothetical protein
VSISGRYDTGDRSHQGAGAGHRFFSHAENLLIGVAEDQQRTVLTAPGFLYLDIREKRISEM